MAASLSTIRGGANHGACGARVLLGAHVGAPSPKPQTLFVLVGPVSCRPPDGAQTSEEGKAAGVLAVPSTLKPM